MATDLRCPNCEDNLGKDKENSALASCGTCGEQHIYNPYGDMDDLTDEELAIFKRKQRKKRGY